MNLKLLNYDHSFFEKKYRITISKDSFTKYSAPPFIIFRANPKSMATIIYFLLTSINEEFKKDYAFCWFPNTLNELKEFKSVTMDLVKRLEAEHILPENTLMSKSVLETASGKRLWQFLRAVSDCVLRHEIKRIDPHYKIPSFLWSLSQIKSEGQEESKKMANIRSESAGNINSEMLKRSKAAILMHIKSLTEKFKREAAEKVLEQSQWKVTAEKIYDEYHKLREENKKLQAESRRVERANEDKRISNDIASIDRIPIIQAVRESIQEFSTLYSELESSSHFKNLEMALSTKHQSSVFKKEDVLENLSKEEQNSLKECMEKDNDGMAKNVFNVSSLLKLQNEKLKSLKESLKQKLEDNGNTFGLRELLTLKEKHTSTHQTALESLKALQKTLV